MSPLVGLNKQEATPLTSTSNGASKYDHRPWRGQVLGPWLAISWSLRNVGFVGLNQWPHKCLPSKKSSCYGDMKSKSIFFSLSAITFEMIL